jgi:hypothetical protein
MRQVLHAALILLGTLPWLIAYWAAVVAAGLCWLADKAWPEADRGNCWSYALPKWIEGRGVLAMSFVEDARFLGLFPVIHCAVFPEFPRRASFEMTQPVERRRTQWFPWWSFYFRFRVVRVQRHPKATDTAHGPLDDL